MHYSNKLVCRYRCDICGSEFHELEYLEEHMKKVHRIKVIKNGK
jgi:hypothetical protein